MRSMLMPLVRRVISTTFVLNLSIAFDAILRLGRRSMVKLSPRNFLSHGRATSLFALLIFSFSFFVMYRKAIASLVHRLACFGRRCYGEWRLGILPTRSLRTVREPLGSYGSRRGASSHSHLPVREQYVDRVARCEQSSVSLCANVHDALVAKEPNRLLRLPPRCHILSRWTLRSFRSNK